MSFVTIVYNDDRSKVKVCEHKGDLGFWGRWTESCTGCYESDDGHPNGLYAIHPKHNCPVGSGCEECGYHGVRRQEMFFPFEPGMNLEGRPEVLARIAAGETVREEQR